MGDCSADTTSCSKSLSQQQAIRHGHYQRCLPLWYECVCEGDQVKFLSKLLPENASLHHRVLPKNISGSGKGGVPALSTVFVLEIVLGSHLGSFTYGIKTAQTHRHQNDGCLALSFKIPLSEVTDNRDKTSLPYFHTAIVLLKLYNPNSHGDANFR